MDRSGALDRRTVSSRVTLRALAPRLCAPRVRAASTRMRRNLLRRHCKKLRPLVPFDLGHVYQAEVYLMRQCRGLRVLAWRSFFIYRRVMRRNSGYTRSASRAKAAWSPLLQAFNRLVISAEDSPDGHRCPLATKIYQNVAAFAVRFRLYHRKENKLSE